MSKTRVATAWLDGCAGCHMSLLDIDERILLLTDKIELVFSPLVDIKEYPEGVDLALVEGAVSSQDDLELIQKIRANTALLVSLGDCAVTSNVPAMRNSIGAPAILDRAYIENAQAQPQIPNQVVPPLLKNARPIHEIVKVDFHLPGCPPSAELIFFVLSEVLEGRVPDLTAKFSFG